MKDKKELEELYIKVYDELGSSYFNKGNDDQLRKWGNSEERIREIKIESIQNCLDFDNKGISIYKRLNELGGGNNII